MRAKSNDFTTGRREEKIIASAITTLKDTRGAKLQCGVYTIPFDFVLPSSLPSSVRFPDEFSGRGITGYIHYCLVAELGKFRQEKEVQIASAPFPSDIVPCLAEPTTHHVRSFGMLDKGYLSVGASVENARVAPGETLRVSVACRNETSVDLNRVRVKLMESIEYKAHTKSATLQVELKKFKDIHLPGLDKIRSSKEDLQRNNIRGREESQTVIYHSIYQDLVSRHNRLDIVVPEWARDTYDGSLISISHYLEITFFTKALVDNPSTKTPIVIGNRRNSKHQTDGGERQPEERIATILRDEEFVVNQSIIEVGSRARLIPIANAVLVDPDYLASQEPSPPRPREIFVLPPEHTLNPTAPTESMLIEHDVMRHAKNDGLTLQSAPLRPPQGSELRQQKYMPPGRAHYSPFQLNHESSPRQMHQLPSHLYTAERKTTSASNTSNRLGAAVPPRIDHEANTKGSLKRLLTELKESIHDYNVVATKIQDPQDMALFTMLSPNEFQSIIAHVSMTHQVQVALLLAKQLVYNSAFTCAHCVGALRNTCNYFRSNMVETLLPYCSDLKSNYPMIQAELSDWEKVTTAEAFEAALR